MALGCGCYDKFLENREKLLETTRCIGVLATVTGMILNLVALFSQNWLDLPDGFVGLFKICIENQHNVTMSSTTTPTEVKEDYKCVDHEDVMDVQAWQHCCRALMIITIVIQGFTTFCCGSIKCRIEGNTFREKHFGECCLLGAACLSWLANWLFSTFFADQYKFQDGDLGQTQRIGLVGAFILATGVICMMCPTFYAKWQERFGGSSSCHRFFSRSRRAREADNIPQPHYSAPMAASSASSPARVAAASGANAQGPPSYEEVADRSAIDRFRLIMSTSGWRMAPLPNEVSSRASNGNTTASTTHISVITVDQTHISSFPSVTDILTIARGRSSEASSNNNTNNNNSSSSNSNNNSSTNDTQDGSLDVTPPPSYDSLPELSLSPPPAYDNLGLVIDLEEQTPEAPPPSYEDSLAQQNHLTVRIDTQPQTDTSTV